MTATEVAFCKRNVSRPHKKLPPEFNLTFFYTIEMFEDDTLRVSGLQLFLVTFDVSTATNINTDNCSQHAVSRNSFTCISKYCS